MRSVSGNILDPYYIRTDGLGGRGCWVHAHSNGQDYVVTPNGWGPEPTPGKLLLINGALEAITRSREVATRLSSQQSLPIYIVLNDSGTHPNASWPISNRCWVVAGSDARNALGAWRGEYSDTYRQMIAHEIGHCFITENVTGFTATTYTERNAKWWDESGATYISTLAYPDLNQEDVTATRFDLDNIPFDQPYRAFLVLGYLVENADIPFWTLLEKLHSVENGAPLYQLLRSNDWDRTLHEFYVDHHRGEVSDFGCDAAPCITYSRESDVFTTQEIVLSEDSGFAEISLLYEARLNLIELEVPEGKDLILTRAASSINEKVFGSIVSGAASMKFWPGGVRISGSCEGPAKIQLALTHVDPSQISNFQLPYRLVDRIDCDLNCSDSSVSQCLPGIWRLDNASFDAYSPGNPVDGILDVTIRQNGALSASFDLQFQRGGRTRTKGVYYGCLNEPAQSGQGGVTWFTLGDTGYSLDNAASSQPENSALILDFIAQNTFVYTCTNDNMLKVEPEIVFSRIGRPEN